MGYCNKPPISYFAGHFDGEGSIYMRSRTNSNRCRLHISVTAGYAPILNEYKLCFGGQVTESSRSVNKLLMRWTLNDLGSQRTFLQAILPFSYEKRSQIETALHYLNERRKYPLRGNGGDARNRVDTLSQETLWALKQLKRVER